jgi:uncharacterized OsmC-like protein
MSRPAGKFTIHVENVDGYEFRTTFDKPEHGSLLSDEPPPLGADRGPNPTRLLAAAVGNCLAASLLFCLSRAGADPKGVNATVSVELVRNDQRHLRVGRVDVSLQPNVRDDVALDACLEKFEDFCVVTQSVREGLDVAVHVERPAAQGAA